MSAALELNRQREVDVVLREIVQNTFESLFFMEVLPLPAHEIEKIRGVQGVEVEIDIKGTFSAKIKMCLSQESAMRLVSLHFGGSAEIKEDMIADTFAEILNTIAGRVAASVANSSYSFDLSIPKVTIGKIVMNSSHDFVSCYHIEFGCVGFVVQLNQ